MLIERHKKIGKDIVGIQPLGQDVVRQICIRNSIFIFHLTLSNSCSFKQQFVIESIILFQHSGDQSIGCFKVLVGHVILEFLKLNLKCYVVLHYFVAAWHPIINFNKALFAHES